MNKKTVLVISPPLASPAMPSFAGAVAAGCFSHAGLNVIPYDANLDFFVNHLFSNSLVKTRFKAVKEREKIALISSQDFRALEKMFHRLCSHPFPTDFFRSELFYDPEKYLAVKKSMDDLFLLYSYSFYPSRIRWGSLPGSVMDDPKDPLFLPFCHEKMDLLLKQVLPEVVLLALDGVNQIPCANTLIDYITGAFPEIQVVILGHKNHTGKNRAVDHIFSLENRALFFKWINTRWNLKCQYADVEPDFSIFPLKEYLAPELILPVQPLFFKDMDCVWGFVAKANKKINVKGFLFENGLPFFEVFSGKKQDSDLFWGVQAPMEDLGQGSARNETQSPFPAGTTLVQWSRPGEKESFKIKMLWDLSKQGIWNHVNLSGLTDSRIKNDWLEFIALNPNIGHSYENLTEKGPYNTPDLNGMDLSSQPYSKVKPLPGDPFWKFLSDPVHLLLYLKRHGKKNLFCLRADRAHEALVSLGTRIHFHFKKPADLPHGFLDEICAMVEAGGSVDTTYVRSNLEKAYLIGYAEENGIIVGNSSLKHPRGAFIQRLNTITGLNFNHFVERGYTSVRPEYRALGVGARLLEGLTQRAGQYKVFSIISEDNTATQKIAQKNKTKKIAVYHSEKVGKDLGVWMPEHMIEKDWSLNL